MAPVISAPAPADPRSTAVEGVAAPARRLLRQFLEAQVAQLCAVDATAAPVGAAVVDLVAAGGKMLRPAFVYWGYRASGAPHDEALWAVGGAVELLHAFALIHDDVMDRSHTRRGRPATHVSFADLHRRHAMSGDPEWFGVSSAVLAGDLAFVWADALLERAELPVAAMTRVRGLFTQLRLEVMAGQYLDLRLAAMPHATEDDALRVALLKSGRYSVTRPLLLGAAVGGHDPALTSTLTAYGDAVGVGFQLRDDVLGLFGNPRETGKEALADLREGKRTVLILRAMERGGSAVRAELEQILGDPACDEARAARAQQLVVETGALDQVERLIDEHHERALRGLDELPRGAREALGHLAALALHRRS